MFIKLPDDGLWVPTTLTTRNRSTSGSLEFVGVSVSYQQVYGSKPSWNDLEEVLAPYSLERIVDTVCRISACLYGKTFPWDRETQYGICNGLFGPNEAPKVLQAVVREFRDMKEADETAPLLLFHEQQALNLLKAAFLIKDAKSIDSGNPPVGIGKALLMISDFIDGEPGDLASIETGDSDYLERWLRYILANQLFSNPTVGGYALARSYDLYLTDKPHLKNCGSYVNLSEMLKSITRLDSYSLWSVVFPLAAHWTTIKPERISESEIALNREGYFSKDFLFTPEEIDSFLNLCAADVADLKIQIEKRYTPNSLRPFDVLPFAKYPIVDFDRRRLYATSASLLMQKLTTGLHHFYLSDKVPPKQRDKYLTYMGEVFGDYVHRSLLRMFPPMAGRYIRLDDLRPEMRGKYCDGLIAYEESVVLIEEKASLFPLEARAG